jgi:alginate O-acetyltransferase complex protein AlgJ
MRGLFWNVAMTGVLLAVGVARGAEAKPPTREEAIKLALAAIDKQIADHGGSAVQWGESLKGYREAVAKATAGQWPWPAKQNFVYQGKEVAVMKRDTFDNDPPDKRPFDAILAVHKKLKEQGVDLIFVPLPDKLAIYPDYLSDAAPADRMVHVSVAHLMKKLLENDVECIDLYTPFHEARRKNEDAPLYYSKDSHWRNIGAQLAGEIVAQRLQRYDFVQKALAEGNRYAAEPGKRADGDPLRVVVDAKTKAKYADDPKSPILITGDSNLMYNWPAGAAHMPAQIGLNIGMPLAFAPNTIPSQHYEKVAGKKVVIWANIARCLDGLAFPQK